MKNFLDIDEKIEANGKALEFYYNNYQKTQSKLSLLVLLYSIISIYIVQILKFPFDKYKEVETSIFIIYLILLLYFLYLFIASIYNTFQILKPEDVAYLNNPNYFYVYIKKQYEESLETNDEDTLNAYLKETYLNELEIALTKNIELYKTKSRYFYNAFTKLLPALILYVLCSGIIIFNTDEKTEIEIKNYKEIIKYSDTINSKKNH
ncbi:MAG: hypothetical protein O9282_03775 [Flavobacterium sp.]|jgi:hypothetical protein|uniref:hypothetical protein n=1 Tax=Flavobacterium sp. TaxID=239 RepID=UPI0022C22207|nr:hypothetical protein [Flavobacterium sp.]MCZ8330412.1 hypothetical protein [Flavobacterium sp.]